MALSGLQQYILKQALRNGPRTSRSVFIRFYEQVTDEEQNTITRSIERLVAKGLLISHGRKTAKKWFTDTISLTPAGRKQALRILADQARLPLHLSKSKKRG